MSKYYCSMFYVILLAHLEAILNLILLKMSLWSSVLKRKGAVFTKWSHLMIKVVLTIDVTESLTIVWGTLYVVY